MRSLLLFPLVLTLAACATRPELMPNRKYKAVGYDRAEQDIDVCLDQAEKHFAAGAEKRRQRSAARGAATGAVVGGVIGAFSNHGIIGSAVVGGAGGAVGGYATGGKAPEGAKRKVVNQCLMNKGYEVAGWD